MQLAVYITPPAGGPHASWGGLRPCWLAQMLWQCLLALLLLRVDSSAHPNSGLLHRAATAGNVTALRALLADGALSMEQDVNGETPLIALLGGWHYAVESAWPSLSNWRHFNASLSYLLERGADASHFCPSLDAAVFRNIPALRALLRAMNSSQLGDCLSAPDAYGSTLAHHLAATPSSGLARLLFRARRLAQRQPARLEPLAELSRYLGLNRSAPLWEPLGRGQRLQSNRTILTAAALEGAIGLGEAPDLTSAYQRAAWEAVGASEPGVAPVQGLADVLQRRNLLQRTPLDIACLEGRTHAVHWLLQRLASSGSGGAGGGNGTAAQLSCAHFAAANGHTGVLFALNGTHKGRRMLRARSRAFGTPCEVAQRGGRLLRDAFSTLMALGTCLSSSSSSLSAEARAVAEGQAPECPPPPPFLASAHPAAPGAGSASLLQLPPSFSLSLHQAAGWAVSSREHFLALHLPPSLLHPAAQAADPPWSTWAQANACPLPPLPLSAFVPSASPPYSPLQAPALQALRGNFTALPHPLLLRPSNASAAAAHAYRHFSRAAVGAAWGHLRVEASTVPYARAYGNVAAAAVGGAGASASAPIKLADFLAQHMPAEPSGSSTSSSPHSAPPYVFDNAVLRNPALGGNHTVLGALALHLHATLCMSVASGVAEAKGAPHPYPDLAQLSVGPPLSGAPPHFHKGAINVLHSGLKLWYLVPPGGAAFVDESSVDWWRVVLGGEGGGGKGAYLFLQGPGEALVIPPMWGHSVLNLADSIGVAYE